MVPNDSRKLDPHDVYDGNEEARDFGKEVRAHEIAFKIWESYQRVKAGRREEIPERDPRVFLKDLLQSFMLTNLGSCGMRTSEIAIFSLLKNDIPDLFTTVDPKRITKDRRTTTEVSDFDPDSVVFPSTVSIDSVVFLRNIFAIIAGLWHGSITDAQHKKIIEDGKTKIRALLGHEIPSWKP